MQTDGSRMCHRAGYGECPAHHGEILQGVFYDHEGRLLRALVTMPTRIHVTRAAFIPSSRPAIAVHAEEKSKAKAAARLALSVLSDTVCGGDLFLSSHCPIGWGLGSSTSDVVATLRAVADALEVELLPSDIGRLAVMSETASDSIMFEESAVLFAQRRGYVIEAFVNPLPTFLVASINTDSSRSGVSTLDQPLPLYSGEEISTFSALRDRLRLAIAENNRKSVAEVATASARINNRYLPKPHIERIIEVALGHGALGVQVAHSGSVVGLLFDPDEHDASINASKALGALGRFSFSHHLLFTSESRISQQRQISSLPSSNFGSLWSIFH
jgi:uncharacterized protein involved in propanediol utilization